VCVYTINEKENQFLFSGFQVGLKNLYIMNITHCRYQRRPREPYSIPCSRNIQYNDQIHQVYIFCRPSIALRSWEGRRFAAAENFFFVC
jgi:hypothetical protein